MKYIRFTTVLLCLIVITLQQVVAQPRALRSQLLGITRSVDAQIGIAMLHVEKKDTLTINGRQRFPMQSVFKFHLALAVLNQVDQGNLKLEQTVHLYKDQYFKTHSPIITTYPEGNVDLSLKELIEFTIIDSDNMGCDLLFDVIGGPKKVNHFIHTLGVEDVSILNTEKEMHENPDVQFQNWTTPTAMTKLLEEFFHQKILQAPTHKFLWTTMIATSVGKNRIKGLLPAGTVVAHRTGTGAKDSTGMVSAVNNSGIIILPNGNHVIVSIFITKLNGEIDQGSEVIAKLAKAIYDAYAK
jgi:beta-lactamase class A